MMSWLASLWPRGLSTVVLRELAVRPRHRWFYLRRLAIVGAIVFVMGLHLADRHLNQADLGLAIVLWVAICAIVIVSLATPYLAALSLMDEKLQRTLPVLWLTELGSTSLLAGKLVSGVFFSFSEILGLLPLIMLAVALGGVGASQVLGLFAMIVALVFLCTAMGLCVGVLAGDERRLRAGLLAACLLVYVGLPVSIPILRQIAHERELWGWVDIIEPFLFHVSPVVCVVDGFVSHQFIYWALANAGFSVGLGLLFLAVAAVRLPAAIRNLGLPSIGERLLAWLRRRLHGREGRTSPPIATANPMFWKDFHKEYGGQRRGWTLCLAIHAGVLLLLLLIFLFEQRDGDLALFSPENLGAVLADRQYQAITIAILLWLNLLVIFLGTVSASARSFTRERKARVIDSLLLTDLTDAQIIRGKFAAILASCVPWAVTLVLAGVALIVHLDFHADWRGGDVGEVVEFLAAAGPYFLSSLFACASLAAWCSLRIARNVGLVIALGAYLGWHIVVAFRLGIYLHSYSPWPYVLFNCAVFTTAGIAMQIGMHRRLRSCLMRQAE